MKKILVLTFTLIAFLSVRAQQFVLLDADTTWTWTTIFREIPQENQPEDWASPVNYIDGTVHLRFEIVEKPSDIEVQCQFCFWQEDSETCYERDICPKFSTEGVYYAEVTAPGVDSTKWRVCNIDRNPEAKYYDGKPKIDRILYQFWAEKEGKKKIMRYKGWKREKPEGFDFGEGIDNHIPIKFKTTIIVVAKGAEFIPPKGW